MKNLFKNIIGVNNDLKFQVRIFRDEGVGIIHSYSGTTYYILDSKDYWHDLIQDKVPKIEKCICKNKWFNIKYEYKIRNNSFDFEQIILHLICDKCGRTQKICIDIKYSPTNNLYEYPISICDDPFTKCKAFNIFKYWSEETLKKYLDFMCNVLNLKVICWYWENNKRTIKYCCYNDLIRMIFDFKIQYLEIIFLNDLVPFNDLYNDSEDGIYLKNDIWRDFEMVSLRAPIRVVNCGNLYEIHASSQYINNGVINEKSEEFNDKILNMIGWIEKSRVEL